MKNPAIRHDKYLLRDLHHEIDLYDRKLAYLNGYVDFASPVDRAEAENRMLAKRAPLEKAAMDLAASGVEFEDKDLPRSFRLKNLEQVACDGVFPGETILRYPRLFNRSQVTAHSRCLRPNENGGED